jgi:hypothetical protein
MSIKQFSGTYFLNDDRIIFRFNTMDNSEYKFWLTRKVTHFILISGSQFLEKQYESEHVPAVAKALSEVQQQSMKQTTNFATEYHSGTQYPLGADPILIIDARCEMSKIENKDIFSLDFILPGGSNINLKLPVPSMQNIVLLLEQLNTQAQWGKPVSFVFSAKE